MAVRMLAMGKQPVPVAESDAPKELREEAGASESESGDKKVDKKEKIWYHKSGEASSGDISKMTDTQKHRYVRTGKKR